MSAYAPSNLRQKASAAPRARHHDAAVSTVEVGRRRLHVAVFVLLLGLAGTGFLVELGRSSLFLDEVYSWNASRGDVSSMVDALRYAEVTPPLYYLVLHGWIQLTGGESETLLRLPSVLAGVALVGATYWLGALFGGRRAAVVAGSLATLSPLVLLYAQQVRSYIFVMLLVALAAAAAVQGTRDGSRRMLVMAAVCALLAICMHYTAILVLGPLGVWLFTRAEVSRRMKVGFAAAIVLPLAALVPLALEQLGQGHYGITASYASLDTFNSLRLAGAPFDGRSLESLTISRELGALVTIEALALLAFAHRFRGVADRWLLVACGAGPILAVMLVSTAVQPMALTRYAAVGVPFLLVAIAVIAVKAPRAAGTLLVAAALVASGFGLLASHRQDGQFPNTRAAIGTVADQWQPGDMFVSVGLLGFDGALDYHAQELHGGKYEITTYPSLGAAAEAPRVTDQALAGKRLWVLSDPVIQQPELGQAMERLGYRVAWSSEYAGSGRIQLLRAEPIR